MWTTRLGDDAPLTPSPTADPGGQAVAAIRSWSSRYPNPTNAQALSALESFAWVGATDALRSGVPEDVARGFYPPDGVLPRMRLLAWGWQQMGDHFRSPQDRQWWSATYQYPLWAPLETLMGQLARAGAAPPALMFDEQLAAGDPSELGRSYPAVVQSDLPPVTAAPCPRYLIPPARGQLPILNPSCLVQPVRDVIGPATETSWWPWLLLALFVLDEGT